MKRSFSLPMILLALTAAITGRGATLFWLAGHGTTNALAPRWIDGNWSQGTNWMGGAAPSSGDTLRFHSTNGFSPGTAYFATNNLAGSNVFYVSIPGTNVHLYGNQLYGSGTLISNSAYSSWSIPLKLTGPATVTNFQQLFTNKAVWDLNGNTLTFGVRAGTVRITGVLSNSSATKAGLVVAGAGLLNLNAAGQRFDGDTLVTNGATLQLNTDNGFPAGPGKGNLILAAQNTALDLVGRAGVVVNALTGSGRVTNTSQNTMAHLNVGSNDMNFTFGGSFAPGGRGPINVTKVGTGTMILTSPSPNNGYFQAAQGTLVLGHAEAISNGVLRLASTNGGYVVFSNTTPIVGALAGTLDLGLTNIGGQPMTPLTLGLCSNWVTTNIAWAAGWIAPTIAGTNTYTGALRGAGAALTMNGSNAQELLGPNTFDGPINVNCGKLVLGSVHAGVGSVSVAANATLGAQVSGPGGTLTLSALNLGSDSAETVTNEFQLGTGSPTAPVLHVTNLNAIATIALNASGVGLTKGSNVLMQWDTGSAPNIVSNYLPTGVGGNFGVDAANQVVYLDIYQAPSLIWSGKTNDGFQDWLASTWDINANTNWVDAVSGSPMPYLDGLAVLFDDTAATNVVLLSNSVAPFMITVSNAARPYTLAGSAANKITGIASFTKTGAGTLTNQVGSNTYRGLTWVRNGTFVLGAGEVVPSGVGAGNLILSAPGTLDLNGFTNNLNGLYGDGMITNSAATPGWLRVGNAASNSVFTGVIGGNLTLQKIGTGNLLVTGNNSYTGGTTNGGGGQLLVGSDTALGTGPIGLSQGLGLASADGNTRTLNNPLLLGNPQLGDPTNNGTLIFNGPVNLLNTNSFGGIGGQPTILRTIIAAADVVFNGPFTNGGLIKAGHGTMTLAGPVYDVTNTFVYEGQLVLAGSCRYTNVGYVLRPDSTNHLLAPARVTLLPGSVVELKRFNADIIVGNNPGAQQASLPANSFSNYFDLGGTFLMPNADGSNGKIYLGRSNTAAYFNLQTGGYAPVRQVVPDTSAGPPGYTEFNFDGGTLAAITNLTVFFQGLSNAFVRDGGAFIDTAGHNITIAQPLLAAGSGGLTKNGNGILTLTGFNTYNGPTLINRGALSATTSGSLGQGEVIVKDTAALAVQTMNPEETLNVAALNFSEGASSLSFNSLGNVLKPALRATNLAVNATVNVSVASGNLVAGTTYALVQFDTPIAGAGTFVLGRLPNGVTAAHLETNGNLLSLVVDAGATAPIVWNGTDALLPNVWDIDTTTNWSYTNTPVAYSELPFPPGDNVQFDDSLLGTPNVNLAAALTPGSVRVSNNVVDYVFYGAGRLAGGTGLDKQGTGMLTISNVNTYSGLTTIGGGVVKLMNASALGTAGGGTIVSNGAQLQIEAPMAISEPLTIAGSGPNGNGAIWLLRTAVGNCTFGGLVSLSGDAGVTSDTNSILFTNGINVSNFTLTLGGSNNLILGSVLNCPGISGAGGRLIKEGAGALYLRANSSFDGGAWLNQGAVFWDSNYPGLLGSGKITLAGGTLRPAAYSANGGDRVITNAVDLAGNYTLGAVGISYGALTFNTGPWTIPNSNITLSVNSPVTINSPIGDNGLGFGLTKSGSPTNTLVLGGANTYTGNTTNNAGTLALGPNGSLSNSPIICLASNTTFDVSQVSGGFTLAAGQTLMGYGAVNGSVNCGAGSQLMPGEAGVVATMVFSNNLQLSDATLNLEAGTVTNDLITVAGTLDLSGVITLNVNTLGSGMTIFMTYGSKTATAHTWNIVSTNSPWNYTVDESVPGQLRLVTGGGSGALFWYGTGTNWDVTTTADWLRNGYASMFFNGDSVIFDNNGAAQPVVNLTTTLSPGLVTVNNTVNYTFQGPGKISGPGSLIKKGSGMLTINTTNDYAGGTTISNGIVKIQNPAALGSPTATTVVASGAQLQLETAGVIPWPLTIAGQGVPAGTNITGAIWLPRTAPGSVYLASQVTLSGHAWICPDLSSLFITNGVAGAGYGMLVGGSNNLMLGGPLNGPGLSGEGTVLSKEGMGSLYLRANSTYTGGTFIHKGVVYCDSNYPGLFGSGKISLNGGTLRTAGVSPGYDRTITNAVSVNSSFTLGGGGVTYGSLTFNTGAWTLLNTNPTLTINSPVTIMSPIGDGGKGYALTKAGVTTNALVLGGANTYTGDTIISAGILALVDGGSLASATIQVSAGSTFDVSGLTNGFILGDGQWLEGYGVVTGRVAVATGGTLSAGNAASFGTLTINGDVSLAEGGTLWMKLDRNAAPANDRLIGLSNLVCGGTLLVANLGAVLQAGDVFKLCDAAAYSGAFTNLVLPPLDPGLAWNLDGFTVDGTITVVFQSGAPGIGQQPRSQTKMAGKSVTFSATVTGVAPITYQWYKDGAPMADATNLSLTLPSLTLADNGYYTLAAANTFGTNSSLPATLVVLPPVDYGLLPFPLSAGQRGTNTCLESPAVAYEVYLPPAYATNDVPLPIIYTLNPGGGGMVPQFQAVCSNLNIIAVGIFGSKNYGDDNVMYQEFYAVTRDIRQRVLFDPTAEFVGGFSGGGENSYDFARFHDQHTAGVLAMAGWVDYYTWQYYGEAGVQTNLFVARTTGWGDTSHLSYLAGDSNHLAACKAVVKDWYFDGGHMTAPDPVKTQCLSWLLDRRTLAGAFDASNALAQAASWRARIDAGQGETVLHECTDTLMTQPRTWAALEAQLVLDDLATNYTAFRSFNVDNLAGGTYGYDVFFQLARGAGNTLDTSRYYSYLKSLTGINHTNGALASDICSMLSRCGYPGPELHLTASSPGHLTLGLMQDAPYLAYTPQSCDNLLVGGWVTNVLTSGSTPTNWWADVPVPAAPALGFYRVATAASPYPSTNGNPTIYSTNTVGYLVTALAPGYNFIACPLLNEASNSLNSVLAGVPDLSVVYKVRANGLESFVFHTGVGWVDAQSAPTSEALVPGEGAILQLSQGWTNTLFGQTASGTTRLPAGLSLVSSLVCADGLNQFPALLNDRIWVYDANGSSLSVYAFDGSNWIPSAPPIKAGQSFWLQTSTARDWVQSANDPGSFPTTLTPPAYEGPASGLVPSVVGDSAPVLTMQPQSQTAYPGVNATFYCLSSGTFPMAYQWYVNGVALPNATLSTLTITNCQAALDQSTYFVVVTNQFGAVTSQVATLTVNVSFADQGLVGYYPFRGNADDASGLGNHGTVSNASLTADRFGIPGSAYRFNGSNSYIGFATNSLLQTDNWAVSAWLASGTLQQTGMAVFVGYDNGFWGDGFGFGIGGTPGMPGREISGLLGGVGWVDSGCAIAATNQWHQVVMSREAGVLKFYLDGVQTTNTSTWPALMPTAFRIGSTVDSRYFSGAIDEVRLYNRALKAPEIQALYGQESQTSPFISAQPQNQGVYPGYDAAFSVTAEGSPAVSYQWFANNEAVPGGTNSALLITNCQPVLDGSAYYVVVTNALGSATSQVATLTVLTVPLPAITEQPFSTYTVPGASASFWVAATNPAPLFYQWFFADAPIANATNAALYLNGVTESQAGAYYVVVSNFVGSVTSQVATLTVEALSGILYVSADSPHPTAPYANWSTAAHTIQEAVDASVDGNTVLVTNGIYTTGGRAGGTNSLLNRLVVTKAITVQSVNGPDATWIVGAAATPGLNTTNGNGDDAIRCAYLGTNAVLSGFTLTNGHTRTVMNLNDESGGGVFCVSNANALVVNCILAGNAAAYRGGGACYGTLTNCSLLSNIVNGASSVYGAGAAYSALNNCLLRGNKAIGSSTYGGATYYGSANNCLLDGNQAAGTTGNGGGAYVSILRNCTVVRNSSSGSGGGVRGGWITNCIVMNNTAPTGSNYFYGFFAYSCVMPGTNGVGNISNAPVFVNAAAGNFRLSPASPCIDTGSDALVRPGWIDLDGQPRIAGLRVDMGAYEAANPPSITAQPLSQTNVVGGVATFNLAALGTAPLTYQWYFAGAPLGGQTAGVLTVSNCQFSDAGDYQCVVANAYGSVTSQVATLTVINPPNQPPVLGSVPGLTATKNAAAKLDTVKLLLTAYDPEGDPLTVSAVSPTSAQNGTVTLSGGYINYVPATNFVGSDSFTFQVTDGFNTVTGAVAVTVQAANFTLNRLSPPAVLPGGVIQLRFIGVMGVPYQLQRSSDYINWTTIATQTPFRNGTLTFLDTNPPPGMGVYRTAVETP